ncbi:unnamed protein product [Symbiodinium sp. CCMP2592]|nr:unnamed protein product [Symbiodinium sp. CCMP2592]
MKEQLPHLTPVDLGSMGYQGEESLYVSRHVLQQALDAEGLNLDYYRGYNLTHHNPKQYFDSIDSIDSRDLFPCENTDFYRSEFMASYARWTGDAAGVQAQANGDYVAHCYAGKWWMSPQCRSDTLACIPVITAGGGGWKLQALMHWSTTYGIPAAIAVANSFSKYVSIVETTRSLFYWWVPDATFVALQPHHITFPPYSAQEWLHGNMRTAASGTYISKAVSSNFANQALRVRNFIANMNFELAELMKLLLAIASGTPRYDVACQWVRDNKQRWQDWLPIETNCITGFGLADGTGTFVTNRVNATSCEVCTPGRFSQEYLDNTGATRRCVHCAPGTSQEKSAETGCTPCPAGGYTDSHGRETCDVCDQGSYQALEGQTGCTSCDEVRTTRLLAASRLEDCVCREGLIEKSGLCVSCGEGLSCPVGSTVERLANGSSEERPQVLPMYFSSMEAPLEIYRCQSHCPGGSPGSCDAGRVGRTCSECPENHYSAGNQCVECGVALPALWILGIGILLCGIFSSYYLLASDYTAKASMLTCATCSLGMMVSLFQNLGVIQTASVPFPSRLQVFLGVSQIFLLDLHSLGFSCAVGGPVQRFAGTCAFFFAVVSGLAAAALLTNLLLPRRLSWLAWQKYKTMSTIGQFCQVSFTTMTNVGLVPFMCYRHPAGVQSVLKYSDVFCFSTEHTLMQCFGIAILALSGAFLTSCFYFAWKAPSWSGKAIQGGVRFLIFRFRPNVWWFGLVLIARGPLLSMPAVAAPNMPAVQSVCLLGILLLSLQLQVWYLPWKAPVLNVVDGVTNLLLVMLLAVGLGRLGSDPEGGPAVLDSMASAIYVMMMLTVLGLMFLLGVTALFCKRIGGTDQPWVMNLGQPPASKELCNNLAGFLHNQKDIQDDRVQQVLEALCIYDYYDVNATIVLLSTELGFGSKLIRSRIASQGSCAPPPGGSATQQTAAKAENVDEEEASNASTAHDCQASEPKMELLEGETDPDTIAF